MPRLDRFLRQEPALQVRLLTTLWTPLELDPDANFEIRCGTGSWPGLSAYQLTKDDLFPVCAPRLIDKSKRKPSLDLLRTERLSHVQGFAEGWREWLACAGVSHPFEDVCMAVFDTATLAIDLAVNGCGFMMGRTCLVSRHLADGRLVAPFEVRLKCSESFYLVERAGERLPKPARLFRGWILAEAAR
jgi:LysR family glycine cleavage system transcriptional activator